PPRLPRRGAAAWLPDRQSSSAPSRPACSGTPRAADEFLAFRRRRRHRTQNSHDHHEPQPIARYRAEEGSDPRNGDDYPMKRLSDGLGPTNDPEQRPDPLPEPTKLAPATIQPREVD